MSNDTQTHMAREVATDRRRRAPWWLWVLLAVAVFCLLVYVFWQDRGQRSQPEDYGMLDEALASDDPMVLGQRVYLLNCAICHQADGTGVPGLYPPLVDSEWVQGDPDRLIRITLHGLMGRLVIRGVYYNSAMTPFVRLSDRQIAAVLTFIRGNPDWKNNAPPVRPEDVAAIRAMYPGRTHAWTAAELAAVARPQSAPAGQ